MPDQLEIPTNPLPAEVDTDLRPDELTGSAGYFVRTDLRAGNGTCPDSFYPWSGTCKKRSGMGC